MEVQYDKLWNHWCGLVLYTKLTSKVVNEINTKYYFVCFLFTIEYIHMYENQNIIKWSFICLMYLCWGLSSKILRCQFCFYGYAYHARKRFETLIFLSFTSVFWNLCDGECSSAKEWGNREKHNWFITLIQNHL